ncbi:glycoside hydrolase family 28 protein [Duganella callida]|uniref:Glycoside hydrolase family 28 protein n=1 Tax=Duganella callida TaxID=2561932 RepID=A0A4Y9SUV6_9BURK|nr:glycoside hydrolase family 28 protein [Duganella callida]TFW29277.1 glycoside hydrolase family 28 protein [Duganella callida]
MLKSAASVLAVTSLPLRGLAAAVADPWARAQRIIDTFAKPLGFPARDFVITSFGAQACGLVQVDGLVEMRKKGQLQTPAPQSPDAYPAIRAAIAAAHKAGGGRVLIPAGNWYCKGPIVLLSNVHVHLAAGARVFFSANPRDFARDGDVDCGANGKLVLSRWQGNDCLNFSPMVYARGQKNIAFTGDDWTSIIDGQAGVPFEDGSGGCWWGMNPVAALPGALHQNKPNPNNPEELVPNAAQIRPDWRSDDKFLPILSEAGIPAERRVFGLGHYLRPSMVEFIDCTDVLLEGYLVMNTPFWIHHPVNCRNVHFSKVRMDSIGPNSDGFDPESCDTVLVDGCLFNNGDDCIAIKSGKNRDTQYGPTRNVVIQNSIMNSGHGGVTLGSEMAAGIEHVYAQKIEFRNAFWQDNPLGTAIRMKSNMNRGGFLRHFYVRDVTLPNGVQTRGHSYKMLPGSALEGQIVSTSGGAVITIDCDYAPGDDSVRNRPPQVSDVHISNVRVANAKTADGDYSCYQAMVILGPVAGSFNGAAGTPVLPVSNISISDSDFGTPRNREQPWFAYNVDGLKLRNVRIAGKTYNQ